MNSSSPETANNGIPGGKQPWITTQSRTPCAVVLLCQPESKARFVASVDAVDSDNTLAAIVGRLQQNAGPALRFDEIGCELGCNVGHGQRGYAGPVNAR
jgi:hypothetical protein